MSSKTLGLSSSCWRNCQATLFVAIIAPSIRSCNQSRRFGRLTSPTVAAAALQRRTAEYEVQSDPQQCVVPLTVSLRAGVADWTLQRSSTAYATKTAAVVRRLEIALRDEGRSARQFSLAAQIDPGALSRLRNGQAVPDLATLDALEAILNSGLWGQRAELIRSSP